MVVFILIPVDSTELFEPREFGLSVSDKRGHLSARSWFLSCSILHPLLAKTTRSLRGVLPVCEVVTAEVAGHF